MAVNYIPQDLLAKFEFHSYGHALEILGQSFPNEWHEILDSLRKLEITTSDLRMQGGNETNIPKNLTMFSIPMAGGKYVLRGISL